jgi:hypothetical protein
MIINDKILSLPPYLSTSWKNVISVQVQPRPFGHSLIIELVTGNRVEIPNVEQSIIEKVFFNHTRALDQENKLSEHRLITAAIPFNFPEVEGMMSVLGSFMSHNIEQKNTPPLPAEILDKLKSVLKGLQSENDALLHAFEPGCNCPYCQVMRAASDTEINSANSTSEEEVVSEKDLSFKTWDIKAEGNKIYTVTNPLDNKEYYTVFLGHPLGCTCGSKGCEHINAVLKSDV